MHARELGGLRAKLTTPTDEQHRADEHNRANRNHALLRKWFVILRAAGEGTVMGYAKLSIAVTNLRSDPLVEFDADDAKRQRYNLC